MFDRMRSSTIIKFTTRSRISKYRKIARRQLTNMTRICTGCHLLFTPMIMAILIPHGPHPSTGSYRTVRMFLTAKVVNTASSQIKCDSFIASGKIATLTSSVRPFHDMLSHGLYGMCPSAVLVNYFGSWLHKGGQVASCFGAVHDSHGG